MFRKILVANDGSTGAMKAVHVALDLAKRTAAELHVIAVGESLPRYVEEPLQYCAARQGRVLYTKQDVTNYFDRVLTETKRTAASYGVRLIPHVASGNAIETILSFVAAHTFDLLVVGFVGHSEMFGRNWGTTSQDLARLVPCPVLVAK